MTKRIVTVTHPDGTKKVIVGKQSTSKPIKTNTSEPIKTREIEAEESRRAKPITPKAGITDEKYGYKYGGKLKFKQKTS